MTAYKASHVYVEGNPTLSSLRYNVRRNPEASELPDFLPFSAFTLDEITATDLPEAYRLFGRGRFAEALVQFRSILQKLLMVAAKTDPEAKEVRV